LETRDDCGGRAALSLTVFRPLFHPVVVFAAHAAQVAVANTLLFIQGVGESIPPPQEQPSLIIT
jgi:hypothetical protein